MTSRPSCIDLPQVMLWAWERPENLAFLADPEKVGVAYLAQTVTLSADRCFLRRRVQPLVLPPDAQVAAVIRIEIDSRQAPTYCQAQLSAIVDSAVEILRAHKVRAVQIDFDARVSERNFYKALLIKLKNKMPENVGLSITALASWCFYDPWLAELPVDEAVPMMFQMGRDKHKVLLQLERARQFAHPVCNHSLGISLDEPQVNLVLQGHLARQKGSPRVYVFNSAPWTKETCAQAVRFAEVGRGN